MNAESKKSKNSEKKINRKQWIRPTNFKIADEATLERILNPPPKPKPEYKGLAYVAGIKSEAKFIYVCTEPNCPGKFTTQTGLTLHSNKHLNKNIRCSFCRMIFKSDEDRTKHQVKFHPNLDLDPDANPLQCKLCSKISRDTEALWRHVRESHRDKKFPCEHCGFPFTRPENLREHLKTKHSDKGHSAEGQVTCKTCQRTFDTRSRLRAHTRRSHRGKFKTYRCVICDTIYACLHTYRNHIKSHCSPKYAVCKICNVNCLTANHLDRHKQSFAHKKAAQKYKACNDDDDALPSIKIVAVKSAVNPNLSKEQLIDLCRKTTVSVNLHRVDERVMNRSIAKVVRRSTKLQEIQEEILSGENPSPQIGFNLVVAEPPPRGEAVFGCMYCDKEFSTVESVTAHETACFMKIKARKVIICPICDKEFDKSYKLKMHSKTHSSEKNYPCSFCSSSFKSVTTKYQHERIRHFGIIPDNYNYHGRTFPCTEPGCDKVYKRPEMVRKHKLKIHVGIRFPCDICGRVYKERTSYNGHVKRDHAECPIVLECKPCGRLYKGRQTYLFHLDTDRHARKVKEYEKVYKEEK